MDKRRWKGKVLEFHRYLHFILFFKIKLVGCSSSFFFFFKSGRTLCLLTRVENLECSQGWALRPARTAGRWRLSLCCHRAGEGQRPRSQPSLLGVPILYSPEHICWPGPSGTRSNESGCRKKNSIVEAKSPPLPTFCARLRNLGENVHLLRDNLGLTLPLF